MGWEWYDRKVALEVCADIYDGMERNRLYAAITDPRRYTPQYRVINLVKTMGGAYVQLRNQVELYGKR